MLIPRVSLGGLAHTYHKQAWVGIAKEKKVSIDKNEHIVSSMKSAYKVIHHLIYFFWVLFKI
jgi:hypothetical protein